MAARLTPDSGGPNPVGLATARDAAGLAWGLVERSRDNDAFGLAPVLHTAIGVGFYAGTAVYAVRRSPR